MRRLRGFVRSVLSPYKRKLYLDVKPHSRLLIESASPVEVSCLPACEGDRSSVIIPDCPIFQVHEGWRIAQEAKICSHKDQINKIRIPARREVEILQKHSDPVHFMNYEGLKTLINSPGPVNYTKIKVSDLTINSGGDVSGSGYLEGNLNLFTKGSFKADNITSQSINILFGGTNFAVHSVYCEVMDLHWLVPENPSDGVTPLSLLPLSIYLGTLHGRATIEVDGDADTNIGSFEGSLYLRQRLGNITLHIGGPCPHLQIDVAEGNVELSLPLSTIGGKVSGFLELQAPHIDLDRDALPADCLDNWELSEAAETQTFFAGFNNPDENCETLWRVRILRGRVRLTGASWADAMTRCIERTKAKLI